MHQKLAIDEAHGAMALVGEKGEFLHVNPAWCKLTGYSKEELLKKTWMDITVEEDISTDQAFVDGLLAKTFTTYQMIKRYIRKDGSTIKILLTVLPVYDLGNFKHFISQAVPLKEFHYE